MIKVHDVSKQYFINKQQRKELNTNQKTMDAVNRVSFVCKPGRIFSLLGPNGAGKTTMLRMIAGLLKQNSGDIFVDNLNTLQDTQKVKSKIGFLTGTTSLYERLTAEELVAYFGQLYGLDKHTFNLRKNLLFDQLHIHPFAKKRISQLSTGMKQKVSIARSMIHNPSVIIFDEPTAGLDIISAHNLISLIQQCKAEHKTIIFSTHIMSEVDLLCDDLAIIANGNLIFNDTMENFRLKNAHLSLSEAFIQIIKENAPSLLDEKI